jgi:hypothetical protein
MRTLDAAGRWTWTCLEYGQLRADGAAHPDRLPGLLVGHWRKPVGDVLDRIHAISHLSRWGALAPLQGDFGAEIRVTIVTIGTRMRPWFRCWLSGGRVGPTLGVLSRRFGVGMDLEGLENLTLLDG